MSQKSGLSALACVFFVSVLCRSTSAIKGGAPVSDLCRYQGIAAVVAAPTNTVLCAGVMQPGNILLLPELCQGGIKKELAEEDLRIMYGDGTYMIMIPKGWPAVGDVIDGLWHLELHVPLDGDCADTATLYSPAAGELDVTSCEMVGFGADELAAKSYDSGDARAVPVTKSTGAECCDAVRTTMADLDPWLVDDSAPFNCLTSPGAGCSLADIGSPVYCDTKKGEKVVIALTATAACKPGSTFLAHDVTSGKADVKFGIASGST